MVVQKSYYKVVVPASAHSSLSSLKEIAEHFNMTGIQEYSMEESEVDEVLGSAAYCGGELPTDLVSKVEASKHDGGIEFYFDEKKSAEGFFARAPKGSLFFEIDNEDWNIPWRAHYKPIEISENLRIVPEWQKDGDKSNEIYIYPGMGFGTGTHETTALCLTILSKLKRPLPEVLDFGCGSGILGIAAIKLFNSAVTFCDIDKEALHNTVQNLEINFKGRDLSNSNLITREKFKADKKYDLVFANILAPILIEEADTIIQSLGVKGDLILSGLLLGQGDEIREYYEKKGLKFLLELKKNDWCALHFVNL